MSSFSNFKAEILTPDSWVEHARCMYASGIGADEIDHYMAIYDTIATTCDEQCSIIDQGVDYTILSSALGALPRLRELSLHFNLLPEGQQWLTTYFQYPQITMHERSCRHHIRIVSNALRRARNRGIQVPTVNLSGLSCYARQSQQDDFCRRLADPLTELLASVQVLRVARCPNMVGVLSQCALSLRHFDMCCMYVPEQSLKGFLESNKKSLRSIGFHNVTTTQPEQFGFSFCKLSSDVLCCMLNLVAHSGSSHDAVCESCLGQSDGGWSQINMAGDPAIVEPSLEVSSGDANSR